MFVPARDINRTRESSVPITVTFTLSMFGKSYFEVHELENAF